MEVCLTSGSPVYHTHAAVVGLQKSHGTDMKGRT